MRIGERPDWCVYFATYCYRESGITLSEYNLDPINNLPCNVGTLQGNADDVGKWEEREGYTPQPGDIIVMKRNGKIYGHVGLVVKVENSKVYTIEGNTGNSDASKSVVAEKEYDLTDTDITGYIRVDN